MNARKIKSKMKITSSKLGTYMIFTPKNFPSFWRMRLNSMELVCGIACPITGRRPLGQEDEKRKVGEVINAT